MARRERRSSTDEIDQLSAPSARPSILQRTRSWISHLCTCFVRDSSESADIYGLYAGISELYADIYGLYEERSLRSLDSSESAETRLFNLETLKKETVILDVKGGLHDLSRFGVSLEIPPYAVTRPRNLTCTVMPQDVFPSPNQDNETLVSYIINIRSPVVLNDSITVTLLHSGASINGYETIVKAKDSNNLDKWKQIKEIDSSLSSLRLNSGYIQVKIDKLNIILAVVSRLIKDTFQVTEEGCVVRSSVCNDVTVEFPKGAVNRTIDGSMKLLLMPDHLDILVGTNAYPCPMLSIDGFKDVDFHVPVKIKLPHPYPAGFPSGVVRVVCMRGLGEWEDITDKVQCMEHELYIELQVSHFSKLWAWIYEVPLTVVSSLAQYLFSAPQEVCFEIFKEEMKRNVESLTMKLVCIPNHKSLEMRTEMEAKGYTCLAFSTGNKPMRPGDRAYTKVEGCYQKRGEEDIFLQFIKNDMCIKELPLKRIRNEERERDLSDGDLIISFFAKKDPDIENELFTFRIDPKEIEKVQNVETLGLERAPSGSSGLYFVDFEEQSTSEPDGDVSCQELVDCIGILDIKSIDSDTAVAKVCDRLQLNKHSMDDPPQDVVKKCRYFGQICKKQGRLDIVKGLRTKLPSGTTGPLEDDNVLYHQMDAKRKKELTRALCDQDLWQRLADELGIPREHLHYYDRQKNPVEELLAEVCKTRRLRLGELYDVLVKCNANAIADKHL